VGALNPSVEQMQQQLQLLFVVGLLVALELGLSELVLLSYLVKEIQQQNSV
jgi:hypothetical protein